MALAGRARSDGGGEIGPGTWLMSFAVVLEGSLTPALDASSGCFTDNSGFVTALLEVDFNSEGLGGSFTS